MYITHKNKSYKFSFLHNTEEQVHPLPQGFAVAPRQSVCILKEKKEDGTWEDICHKQAIVHPRDNFNKEIGRQVSLAKVLQDQFPKEERIIFWNAYANWGVKSPRMVLNIK